MNDDGSRPQATALRLMLVALCSLLPGFAAGAWIGARFFVPPGSGLAGGAMVLGYGLLGTVVGSGAAVFAARRASVRVLNRATVALAIASAILLAIGISRFLGNRSVAPPATERPRTTIPVDPDADLNGDGSVAFLDRGLMKAHLYGSPAGAG